MTTDYLIKDLRNRGYRVNEICNILELNEDYVLKVIAPAKSEPIKLKKTKRSK